MSSAAAGTVASAASTRAARIALSDAVGPKVQILTFKELVEERKRPDLPPSIRPSYKKGKRYDAAAASAEQLGWTPPPLPEVVPSARERN